MKNVVKVLIDDMYTFDLKRVLTAIRPDIVLSAIDTILDPKYRGEVGDHEWIDEAREYYAKGNRVSAIKICRDATKWGLKDAKEYCDANFPGPDGEWY